MSATVLLDGIIAKAKSQYPSGLSNDRIFEIYCADNLLVNYDFDDAEIEDGIVDGSRDAGIDAAYVIADGRLLADDFDSKAFRTQGELELVLIQAKNQDTFKEGPIDKLAASLPLLLDHNKAAKDLEPLFKKTVVDKTQSFLKAIGDLSDKFPKISVKIYYCCKGNQPSSAAKAKAKALEETLKNKQLNCAISLLGAQQLYDRAAIQKRYVGKLRTVGTPISGTNSYATLCKLRDYVSFITDDVGNLITRIFEANVRAYQGEVEVNKEIAASVSKPEPGLDFWWLNNGVTIVADEASFTNNQLVIENPLIVNGLQTSHELHSAAKTLQANDDRCVLLRVIVETEPAKRDKIIRATNRQTSISNSSFRATEKTHVEIEDYLRLKGFFYDRRKNYYKREGKPADKIISIDRLAQGTLAALLQEPHVARARPTTAIKSPDNYARIFSGKKTTHPLEMYSVIANLLFAIDKHFRTISGDGLRTHKNNLRFHCLMVLSWALAGGKGLTAAALAKLDTSKADSKQLTKVTDWVFTEFTSYGPEDKTGKDKKFTERLQKKWSVSATKA